MILIPLMWNVEVIHLANFKSRETKTVQLPFESDI